MSLSLGATRKNSRLRPLSKEQSSLEDFNLKKWLLWIPVRPSREDLRWFHERPKALRLKGRERLERKDDLAARGVESTDRAGALIGALERPSSGLPAAGQPG